MDISNRTRKAHFTYIKRTANATAASIEDVGVDHRSFYAAVAEQFLHRANVRTVLQQMYREAVPQCMCRDMLVNICFARRLFERTAERIRISMVA